jgi:hypothetical protein
MEKQKKDFYIDAILNINVSAEVAISGDRVYENIQWLNNTTPIAEQDILDKQDELWSAYQNKQYARKRAEKYPSVQDFMEAYCEKEIGGDSTKWDAYKTAYNKVRSDNPKE